MLTGAADKSIRLFLLTETMDGGCEHGKVFEEQLDSEVGFVGFSHEDDLMVACTEKYVYLYGTKKRELYKKIDFKQIGQEIPTRCIYCL